MAGSSSRLIILERVVVDEDSTVLPALWDLHLLMTNGGRHRTVEKFTALLGRVSDGDAPSFDKAQGAL